MTRRELIALLGSTTAVVWPVAVRGQPTGKIPLIGVLLPAARNDPQFQTWFEAFQHSLQQAGWTIGENVRIDARWATTNAAAIRAQASELVALGPEVILAHGASTLAPLQERTRTVPIVFAVISDPVAAGYVLSLARPGGNATGFMVSEYSLSGKYLELLKQIAPSVTHAAILRDPSIPTGVGAFGVIQGAAASLGVEVTPMNVRDVAEIERTIASFAGSPNGGLILTPSGLAQLHRGLIVMLAARHKLPAVYFQRNFAVAGGLISYGPDYTDQYRRAARYVDRILKGDKAADLPVQAPTKYELVINTKTAKALGLDVPPQLLARADEVIE